VKSSFHNKLNVLVPSRKLIETAGRGRQAGRQAKSAGGNEVGNAKMILHGRTGISWVRAIRCFNGQTRSEQPQTCPRTCSMKTTTTTATATATPASAPARTRTTRTILYHPIIWKRRPHQSCRTAGRPASRAASARGAFVARFECPTIARRLRVCR